MTRFQWRKLLPDRATVVPDLLAGLPGAISNVPDGMASGLLAGVSPVNGLYSSVTGPVAGGAASSTTLMLVTPTSAAALATASALAGVAVDHRAGALTLLSLIAGAFMIVASLLRLGRYTRFVSHSVMTGFLTGVAVNIVFGQIPDLAGAPATGKFALAKAFSVITHPGEIHLGSLLAGVAAGALIVGLARTPLASYSSLIALVVPTVAVAVFHVEGVARVKDSGAIPKGFPLPSLPDFSQFSLSIVSGALAVTAIVLVQGAGVAQAAPNPDGTRSSINRDFLGQGIANVVTSLFHGQPVGGSVGSTALNVASGARTRWAAIFAGLELLIILVAFSTVIGNVVQPTLAALLIVAAYRSIRPGQILTILRTGLLSQIALILTFGATLFLPVATAVGLGVALSLVLQLNQEAMDLRLVQMVRSEDGWREQKAPKTLTSRSVVVLDIYGSLLYAGSRTLQVRLPDPLGTERAAVVIRLRGRTQLGATFFLVVEAYGRQLKAAGGKLFLSGVDPDLVAQYRSRGVATEDLVEVFQATDLLGRSTTAAFERAEDWVHDEAE